MAKAPPPRRGEVWTVQFGPSVGAEIRKIRPAVVVSLDTVGRLPLRIVVLIKDSGADAFQVKSVSENRFVRCIGQVTSAQVDDIASAVAMCVGAP
jgi:mRNA interferase MazF